MSSSQKIILVGYLGGEPENRTLPSGDTVTNASLAVTETWKDKQGEKKEKTTWFRLAFWGALAAIADNYLSKSSLIYVEGTVDARGWTAQDGEARASLEVRVREMKMLGGKRDESPATPARTSTPAREPVQERLVGAAGKAVDDFDDDIPF